MPSKFETIPPEPWTERARRLLDAAGFSPYSLAIASGLHKSTLSRLLNGERYAPSMDTVLAIAPPLSKAIGQALTIGQVNGHEPVRLRVRKRDRGARRGTGT